jgi:DNA-binding protein Alba
MSEEKQGKEPAEEPAEEEKAVEAPNSKEVKENTVFIGKKPVMNYVTACLTFFNSGSKKVALKARGRAISRAVDTVELLRRVFVKDLQLKDISIGTEQLTGREGQTRNVSTIVLRVNKP